MREKIVTKVTKNNLKELIDFRRFKGIEEVYVLDIKDYAYIEDNGYGHCKIELNLVEVSFEEFKETKTWKAFRKMNKVNNKGKFSIY